MLLDIVLFVLWFLIQLSQVLWSLFLIVAVAVGLFSKDVRNAFTDFVILVTKTAWRLMHIHWYKTVKLKEDHTQGNLVVLRMKLCRCGSIKTRTEAL